MKFFPLLIGSCALLSAPFLSAQENKPAWVCRLAGGTYLANLASISSISTHEYVVDGTVKVYELDIDTGGSALARFYTLEPATPPAPGGVGQSALDLVQQRGKEVLEQVGGDATNQLLNTTVIKNYPATTHAKTIEYRVPSRDAVDKLFKSVESAWRHSQETSIKLD